MAGVQEDAIDKVVVEALGELVEGGHNFSYNIAVDNKSILHACCYVVICGNA